MRKLICLAMACMVIALGGCSGEVEPDEPTLTTESTTEAATTEALTIETTTTTEAQTTTSRTTTTSRVSPLLIEFPVEKVSILFFGGPPPSVKTVKELDAKEIETFKGCMESNFWRTAEDVGSWVKYSPSSVTSTEHIIFVQGSAGRVSVLHLWTPPTWGGSWGGCVSVAHLKNSSLTPDQYQQPTGLTSEDFERYWVEPETYGALYALCE